MDTVKRDKNKSLLFPKIRFGQFHDNWIIKPLGEIVDVKGGKRLPLGYSLIDENNGFPYITVSDIENGSVSLSKIKYVPIEAVDLIKNYKISVKDIFISVAGTLGLVGIIPETLNNANLTENCNKLTNLKCDQKYLFQFLKTDRLNKLIQKVSTIGAQPKLAIYAIKSLAVSYPSLPEQKKIASFLSEVDKKIQQLSQKKELLEQYKIAVMQQLFSQKLRYKDENGKAYPSWKNFQLIDIADKNVKWSFTGGPFGSNLKAEDYTDNGVRILQLQNIGDGVFYDDYKIYTSEEKADELLSCNIYPGEILISKMGDPVARACRVPKGVKRYLMASDGIRFVPDSSRFNSDFIFYSINHPTFRNKAFSLSTGSTRKRIGLTELKTIEFSVPILEEQNKIANFLTKIDIKIEGVNAQISQTQTFKKGLLQQMFV